MNDLEQLTEVMIKDRKAITSSLNVAEVFNKRHDNVLRIINRIKKDWNEVIKSKTLTSKMRAVNQNELTPKMSSVKTRFKDHFKETTYITKDGRQVRSYDLDRFAFTMLVTGFNGKKAMEFKLAYFTRFDEMEQELTKRKTLYDMEKELRKQLTDCLKEHYAGDDLSNEIRKMTTLLYMVSAGNNASKLKRDRGLDARASAFADALTSDERQTYIAKEMQLIALYQIGVTDYHELKEKLQGSV
ncbi:Rha family transcriptional regulator [Lactobacillus sp. AN1001]